MALRKAVKRGRTSPTSLKITAEDTFLPPERILESWALISSSVILGRERRVRFPAGAALEALGAFGPLEERPKRASMESTCFSSLAYFL